MLWSKARGRRKNSAPCQGTGEFMDRLGTQQSFAFCLGRPGREDIHTARRNDGQQVAAGPACCCCRWPLPVIVVSPKPLLDAGMNAAPPPSHLRILRRWSSGLMLSDHAPRHPRGSAGQPCRVILSLFFLLCCPSPWLRSRTRSVFFSFSSRLEKNKNR